MGVKLSENKYLNEEDNKNRIDLFDIFYSSDKNDGTNDLDHAGIVKTLQNLCINNSPIGLLTSSTIRSWGGIVYSKKLKDYNYYAYNESNTEENKKNDIEFLIKKGLNH